MGEEVITPHWIARKLEINNLKNRDLAKSLNVSTSQVSQWLSGNRKPSSANKVAMKFYFENLELDTMINRGDVLKISSYQYLPIKIPSMNKKYMILWNHYELSLIVVRSEIDDIEYLDLCRYKYLIVDPDKERYRVAFEIKISDDVELIRRGGGELSRKFDPVYKY